MKRDVDIRIYGDAETLISSQILSASAEKQTSLIDVRSRSFQLPWRLFPETTCHRLDRLCDGVGSSICRAALRYGYRVSCWRWSGEGMDRTYYANQIL